MGAVGAESSGVTVVLVAGDAAGIGDALPVRGVRLLGRTDDPEEAVALVAAGRPEVAVVDLDTAGAGTRAAIGPLAVAAPGTAVLVVSAVAEHRDVLGAVQDGAAGYLVWTGGAALIGDAVRRTAAGEAVFSPGLAAVVLEAYGRLAGSGRVAPTEREADVLRLVVDGLTGRQIAARLVLSPRTVENHVQHVLRKLGLPNRAALVRYAIENGLA